MPLGEIIVMVLMTDLHLFLIFCGIKYGLELSPRKQLSAFIHLSSGDPGFISSCFSFSLDK